MSTHRNARFLACLVATALILVACQPIQPVAPAADAPAADAPAAEAMPEVAPLLGNLGDHHHPITTNSEQAQQYFDEGQVLTYGFNHAEAIRSFEDAIKLDPDCAMCYWGIAYALGPNINAPMDPAAVPVAWAALQKAQELAPNASEAEQAYIAALAARYAEDPAADRAALDLAYAEAMRELAAAYPDDLDAATLAAEALMDLTPWNFWTKEGEPTEYTGEIVGLLEAVLAANPDHIGANHFYIHAVEASNDVERAVPSAERLATLAPGAGHLVHMPAHVYWRTGRYPAAAEANHHAVHSDETYLPDRGVQLTQWYPAAYYNHNVDFLFAAAQMMGDSATAIDAATKLVAGVPADVYSQMPFFEYYLPMRLFALVRFGKWEEILEESQPDPQFQYTNGAWHYGRGLALTRLGRLDEAAEELAQLDELAQTPELAEMIMASFASAQTILQIEAHILAGELAAAQGDFETAISELEAAVALQDGLPYIEPPAMYFPVRQSLGAILLEAGQAEQAEAVYREDLRQYPKNGWSLYGLAQALTAQGKSDEAAEVEQQFAEAWAEADVELTASRF
jgi:tetratricopeptide (TPR) repeat protein